MFHVFIPRWLVCVRPDLINGKCATYFLKQLTFKIRALISEQLKRYPMNTENPINEDSSHRLRFLIAHGKHLSPFS